MMNKRTVAVFDFDGTLTRKDTFAEFVKFAKGRFAFFKGVMLCSPFILAYKLGFYSNDKAKERLFSYFFKGESYHSFQELGKKFQSEIKKFENKDVVRLLLRHLKEQNQVYVISASIEEWVRPWCESLGMVKVLGTQIEVDGNGFLTGKFQSENCYGQEKVNRLMMIEPNRKQFYLLAYGDSRGDKEMIEYADKGIYIR